MQINKTGKLFSFCCMANKIQLIIEKKDKNTIKIRKIGSDIGLLFQIILI